MDGAAAGRTGRALAAAVIGIVMLSACGARGQSRDATPSPRIGSPAPTTPTPGLPPTGPRQTVPPTDANGTMTVATILFPPGGIACGADRPSGYSQCPLTDRLTQRLNSNPLRFAEPLCRCQNPYDSRSITVTTNPSGGIARVALNFGGKLHSIDVSVLKTPTGWFADDTTCTGKGASTSIYAENPPPC